MKTLYPMNREEFMLALGERALVELIKKCFATNASLPSALNDAAYASTFCVTNARVYTLDFSLFTI